VDSLRGQLLIAHAALGDPNFARTVVLMVEHAEEGAMGLVLNRPSMMLAAKAAPDLDPLVAPEDLVYQGGPVAPDGVMVLAEFDDAETAAALVLDRVGFVPAEADFEELTTEVSRARVFAGHAGWGAEQLESELERDDWILEPASADDVFADDPESLWTDVLERKGGQYALVARMPVDPSVN
jgi:putative transcriptional regulator